MIRLGVHCSLKDGLSGAVIEAYEKQCQSMQIFTKSPRIWKMRYPSKEEVQNFKTLRAKYKIYPLVIHTPYLPNLATSDEVLYNKSFDALTGDVEISALLDADYLVIHPGSYSINSTSRLGIEKIANAINKVIENDTSKTIILLENVSGGGRRIGSSFEELAEIISLINNKQKIGICFDTAHAFAAGYDIRSKATVDKTLCNFDKIIGLKRLKALHLNDSMAAFLSKRDRHQHIGKGEIGLDGFAALLNALKNIADCGILETPKDTPDSDNINLSALFNLIVGK